MGNGPMGSFWGILKRGPYYGRKPTGREQLGPMVRGHIAYYNSSPPSAGWASIRLWRPMHNTALPDKCLCCTTVHNTRRNTLWLFHNLFILFPSLLDGGSLQFPNRRKATVFCLGAHLFSYQNNGFFIFPLGSNQSCCLSSSPACSCSVLPPAPQIRYRPASAQ